LPNVVFLIFQEHGKSAIESCQIHIEIISKLQKQLQESSKIISGRGTGPCQTCTMHVEEIVKLQNQLKESSRKILRLQKQLGKDRIKWENAINTVIAGLHICRCVLKY
jgi:ribosome maturation protein Sdo1